MYIWQVVDPDDCMHACRDAVGRVALLAAAAALHPPPRSMAQRRVAQLTDHVVGTHPTSREEIGLGAGGSDPGTLFDAASIREEHVMVAMRDGVRLSVLLFTPPGDEGPWPGLLQQIYGDTSGSGPAMRRLAAHGYVVAMQNFRGCQQSEGRYQGYRALGFGEHQDGYDTVEWLAALPQCDGQVGTMGGSQAGFAQNFTAVAAPPSLKCQYMSNTGLSLFEEGYRLGGLTRYERFQTAMISACRDPADNSKLIQVGH
jgi:predicted acyl esterase